MDRSSMFTIRAEETKHNMLNKTKPGNIKIKKSKYVHPIWTDRTDFDL